MANGLEQVFDAYIARLQTYILPAEKIYPMVDLTCLDKEASNKKIENLAQQANQLNVAAICVFPSHLSWFPVMDNVSRATVVNFPHGHQPLEHVIDDINFAIQQQADEIDYVFPYTAYLQGKTEQSLAHCREAYEFCHAKGHLFKVIIEAGAWPNLESIYRVCRELMDLGCPMLKTSTGKINIGATLPAAFSMLTAIKDNRGTCGIKLSGGIKTFQQASMYVHLAEECLQQSVNKTWFRIGTSQIT